MDILIPNMEMPKERKMFVIEPDGSVWAQIADTSYFCTGCKAVELPPHGRLIEAYLDYNELKNNYERGYGKVCDDFWNVFCCFNDYIVNAPTVLEATNG